MCTYLAKRGATYYFRRVIPVELRPHLDGRAEWMRSLRTKDRTEAKRLIPPHTMETDALIGAAQAALSAVTQSAAPTPRPASYRSQQPDYGPDERAKAVAPKSPPKPDPKFAEYERARFEHDLEAAEFFRQQDAEQEARQEARENERRYWRRRIGFTTRELSPREAAVKDLLREKDFDLEIAQNELIYLRSILSEAKAARNPDMLGKTISSPPVGETRKEPASAVPLLVTFDAYAKEQGIKFSTRTEWRKNIERLIAFVGHDDAARLTTDDLIRWKDALLEEITRRGGKRALRTVKGKYIAAIQATLNWAKEQRKLSSNVAADVVVRTPKKPKLRDRDFTAEEARKILAATLTLDSQPRNAEHLKFPRRWIPWLCAYTGARVNELSQLRREDVQQVEGIWSIRITPEAGTQKTNEARTVPLHAHIIEQGFLEAIKGVGEGPLFYDPSRIKTPGEGNRYFKKVGERLREWVRRDVSITDPNVQPNHGWRHTFKTAAMAAEMPERIADAICGHAPRSVGQTCPSSEHLAQIAA